MHVKFDHLEVLNDDTSSFYFSSELPLRYIAGQFTELTLTDNLRHWFTLSSAPSEPLLAITTRKSDTAYKQALFALTQGDVVSVSQPLGDFVLPKSQAVPLVFIAGGIGITPFRSILSELPFTTEHRQIALYYFVRHEHSILFKDILDKSDAAVTYHSKGYSRTRQPFDIATVLARQPATDALFYIAGPEQMVTDMRQRLLSHNIASEQIVTDQFLGYQTL